MRTLKTDCLFCNAKWTEDYSVKIGKKYVCYRCLNRLRDMMDFIKEG